MTDNSAPGVYTQPGGDADDVLGHRFVANDKKADRIAQNDEAAENDVEGHRIAATDRVQDRVQLTDDDVEGHVAVRDRRDRQVADDEDDVEGHRIAAMDRIAQQDPAAPDAPDFRAR